MLRRNISTHANAHLSCNLRLSVELSNELNWNSAATMQDVRDSCMYFGNTAIEFKESVSRFFPNPIQNRKLLLVMNISRAQFLSTPRP
jgi:hypothetical protein